MNINYKTKLKNNTSGYQGIDYMKKAKRWRARINIRGRSINLGGYSTAEAAFEAYCFAVLKYNGLEAYEQIQKMHPHFK